MKIVKILFFGYFCILHAVNNTDVDNNWTWVLSKKYTQNERAANTQKKELFFKKENTPLFTQLLFSWNIVRPQKGYFSFYARVRDAETKKWGAWHLMADWGANIQKTYVKKSDGLSSFMHVRLELNHNKKADAFCIKIESHDGACASFVDGISVALSNFAMFKAEHNDLTTLKTVIVSGVPTIAQFTIAHKDKGRICSPVSCAMLVQYLTRNSVNMQDFMLAIFDAGLSVYGSWQCNVAHVFNICESKINCFVQRANSFVDLYAFLEKKLPVVVSVRGELPGALKPFPHGHLMVVIGWDQEHNSVICHDPAAESNDAVLKYYPVEPFLRAWERSHRLMYVIK